MRDTTFIVQPFYEVFGQALNDSLQNGSRNVFDILKIIDFFAMCAYSFVWGVISMGLAFLIYIARRIN